MMSRVMSHIYPTNWKVEEAMNPERKQLTSDSLVSCFGLAVLVLLCGAALWILLLWQIVPWLRDGVWSSYPISGFWAPHTSWVGLTVILDWVFGLPFTLLLGLAGIFLFWLFGLLSAKMYQWASRGAGQTITPAQTHA